MSDTNNNVDDIEDDDEDDFPNTSSKELEKGSLVKIYHRSSYKHRKGLFMIDEVVKRVYEKTELYKVSKISADDYGVYREVRKDKQEYSRHELTHISIVELRQKQKECEENLKGIERLINFISPDDK